MLSSRSYIKTAKKLHHNRFGYWNMFDKRLSGRNSIIKNFVQTCMIQTFLGLVLKVYEK